MNNLKTVLFSALLMLPSFAVQSDTSFNMSIASDYFWRGVSQNGGNPALQAGANYDHDSGFYAGVWASEVDYGIGYEHEMDLWAGYNLAMTDDLTVGVGVIRYEFGGQQPQSLPSVEEMYVAGYWKNTNFKYYVDTSNRDLGYLEVSQGLPFIKVLDVKLGYGEFKDGDKHVSLTVEKPLTENLTVGLMVLDGIRHGEVNDSAAVTLAYNF